MKPRAESVNSAPAPSPTPPGVRPPGNKQEAVCFHLSSKNTRISSTHPQAPLNPRGQLLLQLPATLSPLDAHSFPRGLSGALGHGGASACQWATRSGCRQCVPPDWRPVLPRRPEGDSQDGVPAQARAVQRLCGRGCLLPSRPRSGGGCGGAGPVAERHRGGRWRVVQDLPAPGGTSIYSGKWLLAGGAVVCYHV